jgi:hypothetical protein
MLVAVLWPDYKQGEVFGQTCLRVHQNIREHVHIPCHHKAAAKFLLVVWYRNARDGARRTATHEKQRLAAKMIVRPFAIVLGRVRMCRTGVRG